MLFSSIHNRINQKHFRKRTSRKTAAQKWKARRWSFEQLETRMLLSATVWTDSPDYLPGSSAGIFGSGFGAAEAVTVKVQHNNDGYMDGPYAWQVTSLTDGSFQ